MRKGVKKTHEEFLLELNELDAKCEPLEEYNGKDVDIKFKCLRCGGIFHQTPHKLLGQLKTSDTPCPKCNQSISYPEKFFYSFLEQLGCDFIYQYNRINGSNWCENYSYDFYIPKYNIIVETHGLQHYRQTRFGKLEDVRANDAKKKHLAENNGVNYIVIDCRKSEMKYISKNIIESRLSEWFDLSGVNWLNCANYASKHIYYEVCEIYSSGIYTYAEIADLVQVSSVTVGRYIREGISSGLIQKQDWRTFDHKKGVKVLCVELNKEFPTVRSANDYLGKTHTNSSINDCLHGKTKTAFGYHWEKIIA